MISNTASLYGAQAINYSTSLASIPLLVSGLGLEGYGQYSVYFAVSVLSGILVEFGSNYSAVPEVARRSNPRHVAYVWSSLLSLELAILFVAAAAICAVHALDLLPAATSLGLLLVALTIGALNSLAFVPIQLGLGRSSAVLLPTTVSRLSFVAYLVTEREVLTVAGSLIAYMLCTSLLCAGSNASLMRHVGRRPLVRLSMAIRRARRTWSYFGIATLGALYANMNIVLLSVFVGDQQVGLYSVAEKLRNALNGVLQPLSLSMFSEAASGRHGRRRRTVLASLQAAVVVCAVAVAVELAPIGVQYLADVHTDRSETVLLLLLWAIVPTQLRSMLNLQVLIVAGRATPVTVQAAGMLVGHLVLVAFLVPRLGPTGMSASVLCVETVALLATTIWLATSMDRRFTGRARPGSSSR